MRVSVILANWDTLLTMRDRGDFQRNLSSIFSPCLKAKENNVHLFSGQQVTFRIANMDTSNGGHSVTC